jgi:hypothetical protein
VLFRLHMPTLRELLWGLGGSFQAGDWFGLSDSSTGWPSHKGRRPYVLIDDSSSLGPAKVFGRTRRKGRGIRHSAHTKHQDECIVNDDGYIRTWVLSVDSALLPGSYTCTEPDPAVVAAIIASWRRA